jgi:hypothetical protein
LERYEKCREYLVEKILVKAYFRVKTLCATIQEKYDQPWFLSNIMDLNVDREELDDSEDDTNLDEVLPPNDQEKYEEPPYLEHALDKNIEDHTSPIIEPKE